MNNSIDAWNKLMRRCVIGDKLIQYRAINGSRRGKGLWSCKAATYWCATCAVMLARHIWTKYRSFIDLKIIATVCITTLMMLESSQGRRRLRHLDCDVTTEVWRPVMHVQSPSRGKWLTLHCSRPIDKALCELFSSVDAIQDVTAVLSFGLKI